MYKWESGSELLVAPENMQKEVIRKLRNRGHFAVLKTEDVVKQEFYIPNLRKKIEMFVANHIDCILNNRKRDKS